MISFLLRIQIKKEFFFGCVCGEGGKGATVSDFIFYKESKSKQEGQEALNRSPEYTDQKPNIQL